MGIKRIDPNKIIKVCSLTDDAIDQEAMGQEAWEKYIDTYDFSLLKFKEGSQPTIFLMKNLLSTEEAKIKQDHIKVTFPEIADKTPDELKKIDMKNLRPKVEQVNYNEMLVKYFDYTVTHFEEGNTKEPASASMFPFSVVQELGSLALTRSQLGDELKNA